MSDAASDTNTNDRPIQVFPSGPIRIGNLAIASLLDVRSSPVSGAIACYDLDPIDREEYLRRALSAKGTYGLRYAPIPGLWTMLRPAPPRAGGSSSYGGIGRYELWFGIEPGWLHSQASSMKCLGITRQSLLAPFVVRTLALGYVHRVGF